MPQNSTFFEKPILNSPYEEPALHHALDEQGQPVDLPPVVGRRRSELITPVPNSENGKIQIIQNRPRWNLLRVMDFICNASEHQHV